MKNNENATDSRAVSGNEHDRRFSKLSPLKDALHLLLRMVLEDIRDDANMLIVGAGTGPELIYLAEAFPGWHFTAVEPDEGMLETCVDKCETRGILSRCTFHRGPLDTLGGNEQFDGATSLLVSHYLPNKAARTGFFGDIHARLTKGGVIVGADLVSRVSLDHPTSILPIWQRTMRYANTQTPTHVPTITPEELTSIVLEGGFEAPTFFYQALLIHTWFSRKKVN